MLARVLPLRPLHVQLPTSASVCAAIILVFVTAYNVLGLEQVQRRGLGIPPPMRLTAKMLQLDQRWAMFAPTPNVLDGWYVMPAKLADGSVVDVWSGNEPVRYSKPKRPAAQYPDARTKKLMMDFRLKPDSNVWPWIAWYYVREWNAAHPAARAVNRPANHLHR